MCKNSDTFQANSLQDKLSSWQKISAPLHVIDWISNGVKIPFKENPGNFELQNRTLSPIYKQFVSDEFKQLVKSGAIKKQSFAPKCVSPIGVVPKRGGKLRLIVDLRRINTFCDVPKFRYDDIDTLSEFINPNDYIVTVDLKNGFHHIPVSENHQQYLGICFQGQYYVWTVLPFGLSSSPYYFCKTVRPVIQYLRDQGRRVSAYMDDFALFADSNKINTQKELLLNTLHMLGWVINVEKSALTPSMEQEYIGYKICTKEAPVLKIPKSRVKKVRRDINRALSKDTICARILARIAGQCVSMTKAVLPGKLLLRQTYRLLASRQHWEDQLYLDQSTRTELQWWTEALESWNGAPISKAPISCPIATDASATGWGAVCNTTGRTAAGYWTKQLSQMPSNYREMMAVLLALHSFKHLRNQHVQVLTDNITTAAYVNHLGGPSQLLMPIAKSIWMLAYEQNITLTARYLQGRCNSTADALSRLPNAYEWMLQPKLFQYLNNLWGPYSIDRFATFMNAQLPQYNSQHADPQSAGTDALAQQDWAEHLNFVNAPFRLLPRILTLLQAQQAHATIIAPHWPGQPWYQRLRAMARSPPLKIPKLAFHHQSGTPEPLKNPKWRILAWNVCGQSRCTHRVGQKGP